MTFPARGELWWWEAPNVKGRPVVVLSRSEAIPRLRKVIVAPCTTTIRGLRTEVALEPGLDPVARPCVVALDVVENVTLGYLVERLGRLNHLRMRQICQALSIAVDCA